MMRRLTVAVVCLAVLGLVAQSALAVSVHWKKGSPTFSDNGLQLTESGTVAGVGGGNVLVLLSAQANVSATCSNPSVNDGKDQQPTGQNPAPITITGAQPIAGTEIKNGNLTYSVQTQSPGATVAGAPDCPGKSWSENIKDLAFTSAQLVILQDQDGLAAGGGPTPPGSTVAADYEVNVFSGSKALCSL